MIMHMPITKKLIHPRKHRVPASRAFIDILYMASTIGISIVNREARAILIPNSSRSIFISLTRASCLPDFSDKQFARVVSFPIFSFNVLIPFSNSRLRRELEKKEKEKILANQGFFSSLL